MVTQDSTSSPVRLPLMGEGVHEATVIKWLKKKGEPVSKDEPLIEVSTDKVDTEIASPRDGYLVEIYAKEGQTIVVDQIVGFIAADSNFKPPKLEDILKSSETPKTLEKKNPRDSSHAKSHHLSHPTIENMSQLSSGTYAGIVRSSPIVKKMAKEFGINLNQVRGTGLYGRITKQDVYAFIGNGGQRHLPLGEEAQIDASEQKLKTTIEAGQELLEGVPITRQEMSKMRKLTAKHMLESVRTSPHVTTTFEVDLFNVRNLRTKLSTQYPKSQGYHFTFTAFFIEATVHALKKHPHMNASIDGHDILLKQNINIGCAVAIESGLIVPVIKKCNDLSILEISSALNEIVSKARNKQLSPDDVRGGTFSLTNPGMYGSIHSQPIINQPQVGILSIGAIVERPVVVEKTIEIRPTCQIGITFDHRLIDGEGGAKFLVDVKDHLENPKE